MKRYLSDWISECYMHLICWVGNKEWRSFLQKYLIRLLTSKSLANKIWQANLVSNSPKPSDVEMPMQLGPANLYAVGQTWPVNIFRGLDYRHMDCILPALDKKMNARSALISRQLYPAICPCTIGWNNAMIGNPVCSLVWQGLWWMGQAGRKHQNILYTISILASHCTALEQWAHSHEHGVHIPQPAQYTMRIIPSRFQATLLSFKSLCNAQSPARKVRTPIVFRARDHYTDMKSDSLTTPPTKCHCNTTWKDSAAASESSSP